MLMTVERLVGPLLFVVEMLVLEAVWVEEP
jgi:hypothetical protein